MNKENLLAAFGEIDEEYFEERLSNISGKGEEAAVEPVFVTGGHKRNKKPLIIAASAVAACGVFVAGLGISRSNNVDRPQITAYDSSTIFPDIEFADDYKTMYNAEDLYRVETMEIDPEIAAKYSFPSLVDGKKVYFTTDAYKDDMYSNWGTDPVKTAYIVAYDTETKEEKVIYSCTKQLENSRLTLDAEGIYNSYLYFVKEEENNKETAVEVCRVNLNDNTSEVIFSARHPFYSRFVLSKGDSCLYFNYSDTSVLEDTLNVIYRYDTESGKTEKFMENAYVQAAYKNGIIYYTTKDNEFYYHNPSDPNSDTAITNNKSSIKKNADGDITDDSVARRLESFGGSFFLYQDIKPIIDGEAVMWDVGVEDENGDRLLFAGKEIVLSYNSYGTNNGLVIIQGYPGRDKPLIYDYKNDTFSFIDIDPIDYYAFSPLGFNSSESVCVRTQHAENSQYESVTITTVTRKREKGDPYNSSDIFPDMEFAEKYKTMYSAEDLYDVNKMEIHREMIEKYQLPQLADGDKVYFTTRIDTLNYYTYTLKTDPPKTADIILYDNTLNEERVIYSCGKQRDDFELIIRLEGIFDNYLYFYQIEASPLCMGNYDYVDFCRVNLNDLSSQVISSRQYVGYLHSVLSKGENCLYLLCDEYYDNEHYTRRLWHNDINENDMVLLAENVTMCCPYKEGIIYEKEGYIYYHNSKDSEDVILCPDNYVEKQAFGGDFFLYMKGGEEIADSRALGIYGENGERELISKTNIFLNAEGSNGLMGFTTQDKPLIYDYKSDMFSFIDEGFEDGKHSTAFSPLGFAGGEGTAFLQCFNESIDRELLTTRAWVVTVTRKPDPAVNLPDNSKILFPDLEFAEGYKNISNAEDLYRVKRMEIDTDIINKYGYPELTVGDRLYFTTMIAPFYHSNQVLHTEPLKTADIILYDNTAKEEKVIYSCGKQRDGNSVDLRLLGIYDNYLYFEQNEYKDPDEYTYSDFSRLNLTNLTSEVIYSSRSSYSVGPVLSKGENCIYFYYEEDNGGDIGVPRIYRYDIGSGETELFMENVREYWAYKDGIIYRRDGNIYYHTGGKEDTVVCTDNYEYIGAYGGEFFLYQKYLKDTPLSPMSIGIYDKNGERDIITDIPDETYRLCCKQLTEDLVAFKIPNGLEEQPLIYDYKNDVFSFIEADKESCAFSLPCFGDNGGVAFIGYDGDIMEGVTGCQTVTVTRKYEPEPTPEPEPVT